MLRRRDLLLLGLGLSAEGEGLKAQEEGKGEVVVCGMGEKSREAKRVYERGVGGGWR